jgi:uncharacterized protein YecT (DUF1311 family)
MTFALRAALAVSLAIGVSVPSLGQATVLSPQATKRADEPCGSEATQAETLACYLNASEKSRAEVERAFKLNSGIAIHADEDWNTDAQVDRLHRSRLTEQLKVSQAAWLRYSHFQCSFEGWTSHGGSGTGILEAACHYRLNSQRLIDLRAAGRLLNR